MAEKVKEKEVFEDYEDKPVPKEAQYKWYSQGMVWVGCAFCLPCFSLGATMADAMPFGQVVLSCILGSAILWLIACAFGLLGARTHLPSALTSRFALGVGGSKIFGLLVAASLFGWFGYQCTYFGSSAVTTLEMFGINAGSPMLWACIGGVAMMITAIVGFKGIKWLSNIGIPLLFIILAAAMVITVKNVGFNSIIANAKAAPSTMTVPAGIAFVVGGWITATCMLPDISRFSAREKDATIGCTIGFLISYPLILLIGAFFTYAYHSTDICAIMIKDCGLGILAAITLIIATWTTNDNNLYSAVLGIVNALPEGFTKKIPRWVLTIFVGVVSLILAVCGVVDQLLPFLNFLGAIFPPIAFAIIFDYYIYNQKNGLYSFANVKNIPAWRMNTGIAALAGMIVGFLCAYTSVFAGLLTFLPSAVLSAIVVLIVLVVLNAANKKSTVTLD